MTERSKTVCPLCNRHNHCEMESQPSSCWCMADGIEFPDQLLEQLPDALRDKTCICPGCLEDFYRSAVAK